MLLKWIADISVENSSIALNVTIRTEQLTIKMKNDDDVQEYYKGRLIMCTTRGDSRLNATDMANSGLKRELRNRKEIQHHVGVID